MTSKAKQPVLFLSHGGGPSFFMSPGKGEEAEGFLKGIHKDSPAAHYLQSLATKVILSQYFSDNSHFCVVTCESLLNTVPSSVQ